MAQSTSLAVVDSAERLRGGEWALMLSTVPTFHV